MNLLAKTIAWISVIIGFPFFLFDLYTDKLARSVIKQTLAIKHIDCLDRGGKAKCGPQLDEGAHSDEATPAVSPR